MIARDMINQLTVSRHGMFDVPCWPLAAGPGLVHGGSPRRDYHPDHSTVRLQDADSMILEY